MTPLRVELFAYKLPLIKPFPHAPNETHRLGCIIRLMQGEVCVGLGELAPLPGLHQESLSEAITQLKVRHVLLQEQLYPSVKFAWQMALSWPWQEPFAHVKVNALLAGTSESIEQQALYAVSKGYSCIKIKIGDKSAREVIDLVKSLRKLIGKSIQIRLDANAKFSLTDALLISERLTRSQIAYIEDPTQPHELEQFCLNSPIPCALDGAWQEEQYANLPVKAWVIKPNLAWPACLPTHVQTLTITSCFESAVGVAYLAWLANRFAPHVSHGLSTVEWFAHDLWAFPLRVHRGGLCIQTPLELNWSLLSLIDQWEVPLGMC